MHQKLKGSDTHEFTCDYGRAKDCLGEVSYDTDNFSIATLMLKDDKWQSVNTSTGWEHICPRCVEHKKKQAWEKFKRTI